MNPTSRRALVFMHKSCHLEGLRSWPLAERWGPSLCYNQKGWGTRGEGAEKKKPRPGLGDLGERTIRSRQPHLGGRPPLLGCLPLPLPPHPRFWARGSNPAPQPPKTTSTSPKILDALSHVYICRLPYVPVRARRGVPLSSLPRIQKTCVSNCLRLGTQGCSF